MSSEKEILKDRIEARRKELESEYYKLKADTKEASNKRMEEIENRLNELKQNLSDGWDRVTENVAGQLNSWLSKTNKSQASS